MATITEQTTCPCKGCPIDVADWTEQQLADHLNIAHGYSPKRANRAAGVQLPTRPLRYSESLFVDPDPLDTACRAGRPLAAPLVLADLYPAGEGVRFDVVGCDVYRSVNRVDGRWVRDDAPAATGDDANHARTLAAILAAQGWSVPEQEPDFTAGLLLQVRQRPVGKRHPRRR